MRGAHIQRGFTLVEAVLVILITGIIGAVVAVFIKSPVDAYFDTARRAALADEADTSVRRMARDIRKALPNSVRQSSDGTCLEFIPTKTGGRYRAEPDGSGNGNVLNFTVADTGFDMLGANPAVTDQTIAKDDVIVVYNLGIPGASAYAGDNTAVVASAPVAGALADETTIALNPGKQFPLESGSNRFQVVPKTEQTVAYVCQGSNLYRVARTDIQSAMRCDPSGGSLLANNLAAGTCNFYYTDSDLQRNALVKINLGLTDGGETVTLYHEVHVNNTP